MATFGPYICTVCGEQRERHVPPAESWARYSQTHPEAYAQGQPTGITCGPCLNGGGLTPTIAIDGVAYVVRALSDFSCLDRVSYWNRMARIEAIEKPPVELWDVAEALIGMVRLSLHEPPPEAYFYTSAWCIQRLAQVMMQVYAIWGGKPPKPNFMPGAKA